jgi:hypothetical protein
MEQPLGHHGNRDCPPREKGAAMITPEGWALSMLIWGPVSNSYTKLSNRP